MKIATIRGLKLLQVSIFLIGLVLVVSAQTKTRSPITTQSPESLFEKEQTTNSSGCDYAEGKWVVDDKRPYYSGSECKQWLSPMWACRLTQRTDFQYERLRWQPNECNARGFTAASFLQKMRSKTVAFVGDSLGREQFQSLMCMVTGGQQRPDVLDVAREYGLAKSPGDVRPAGWAYRFPTTNTTVLFYWSSTLSDLEPIDGTQNVALHIDRAPSFLRTYVDRFDVLVLNTGHHWNRAEFDLHKWVVYVGGAPNTDPKLADVSGARNFVVHSIVRWADSRVGSGRGLKAFFTATSPMHHFDAGSKTCKNNGGGGGGGGDRLAVDAVKGTKVGLLDIVGLSDLRPDGHVSYYSRKGQPEGRDCLHWCLPGVPDTWNDILFARI